MRPRDYSAAIAISISLVLHGTLCYLADRSGGDLQWASVAPLPANAAPVNHSRIYVDEPPKPTPKRPEPPAKSAQPAPRPAPKAAEPPAGAFPKPIVPPQLAPAAEPPLVVEGFGESTGSFDATAIHSLSGDQPMQGRQAEQDQPLIRRNPGNRSTSAAPSDREHSDQVRSGERAVLGNKGKGLDEQPQVASKTEPPKPTATPTPSELEWDMQQAKAPRQVALAIPAQPGSPELPQNDLPGPLFREKPVAARPAQNAVPAPLPHERPQPATPLSPSPAAEEKSQQPSAGAVGSPDAATTAGGAGDPAPQSDSDSDPFTTIGSANVYRRGAVRAKFGRQVKTVRPDLSLAAQSDLLAGSRPSVTLLVRADETGRVREVTIHKSSGSSIIDQACVQAMYQWTFEPVRDKRGNLKSTEMIWTITVISN